MHVVVTGGTGFIGSALVEALIARGDRVTVLSRQPRSSDTVAYVSELEAITDRVDAVVNLAGASLAARRWTTAYREEIVASRVAFTERLVRWLVTRDPVPPVLLSASAIGFYGTDPATVFDESAHGGTGFAARLCQDWERTASRAGEAGVRVVLARLGVVLDRPGGALEDMSRSFRLGVASWLGGGDQWLSWIHRRDAVRALLFLLDTGDCCGPVNVVAPGAVTHRQLSDHLERYFPVRLRVGVPGSLARLLLGAMADELLLRGQHVVPGVLAERKFAFEFPCLAGALDACFPSAAGTRERSQ